MSGDPLRDLDCAPSWGRNRIPVSMIKELSVDFEVKECCQALRVSRSGYYRWQKAEPGRREKENAELLEQIKEVLPSTKTVMAAPGSPGAAPARPEVLGEPHRSLDAGKQTDRSWQEALSTPYDAMTTPISVLNLFPACATLLIYYGYYRWHPRHNFGAKRLCGLVNLSRCNGF